jgi:hypothetical protein
MLLKKGLLQISHPQRIDNGIDGNRFGRGTRLQGDDSDLSFV